MNIDLESVGLLSLILQDSPKDRQFILCVLARSNSVPTRITFNPRTDYPTFYGYTNSRIPFYLMDKNVLSNVPRIGHAKRLLSSNNISYTESVINTAKNWDIHQKRELVTKFITLDNKTAYKDAEVFLIFRDKAYEYIKSYTTSHQATLSSFLGKELSKEIFQPIVSATTISKQSQDVWNEDFHWERDTFVFGNYGSILLNSKARRELFKKLTDAKGHWVRISELRGDKRDSYVRSTLSQIEKRFGEQLGKYISIPSTQADDAEGKPAGQGAYRIRITSTP